MFAIAKKLNMTQVFTADGKALPVTVLSLPENKISLIRNEERDGYKAVQVSTGNKSVEFPLGDEEVKVGQEIKVSDFAPGQYLHIAGVTKGRGFAGVMKRHGFHGFPASHGHPHQRVAGSIGQMFPQHVRKGMKMAGQMGNVRATEKNMMIVAIDEENSLIFVKGSVPGSTNGFLEIVTTGKSKDAQELSSFSSGKSEQKEKQVKEEEVEKQPEEAAAKESEKQEKEEENKPQAEQDEDTDKTEEKDAGNEEKKEPEEKKDDNKSEEK